MMGSGASSGATDDVPRDGVEAPSRDESFFGKNRQVPAAYGSVITTPVQVYFGGQQTFNIRFGEVNVNFDLWTDVRGLDAIIDACLAAKVRAEISGADLTPTPPPLAAALDPTDVPF